MCQAQPSRDVARLSAVLDAALKAAGEGQAAAVRQDI